MNVKLNSHRVTRVYQGVRNYTPIEINQSWSYVVYFLCLSKIRYYCWASPVNVNAFCIQKVYDKRPKVTVDLICEGVYFVYSFQLGSTLLHSPTYCLKL